MKTVSTPSFAIPTIILALGLFGGCVPPMANMQSARVAEKGETRFTPYAAAIKNSEEAGSEKTANYGALVGFGAGSRTEIQLRYDRFNFPDSDGINYLSIGPKMGNDSGTFAFLLPFGVYWGRFPLDGLATIQMEPGFVGTVPISRHLEVIAATKVIFSGTAGPTWVVANFGLGFSSDVDRWALIPEVGIAHGLRGMDVTMVSVGIAVETFTNGNGATQ